MNIHKIKNHKKLIKTRREMDHSNTAHRATTPLFAAISFFLGNLGDGLNIFQGIYLVNVGWNESAIGTALSLMGLTTLITQTFAGDMIDKTRFDRSNLLIVAASMTALSAMVVVFVREGNYAADHLLMYITKIFEGAASSFVMPCLSALTLASFGPDDFDSVMANNVFWGHVGSMTSAILAGATAYVMYPNIKLCFSVIGISAIGAAVIAKRLPEGDPLLGRGFSKSTSAEVVDNKSFDSDYPQAGIGMPQAESYISAISERKTRIVCATGFFYHLSNANILLVLGELMSVDDRNDDVDDGVGNNPSRSAIPLIGAGIVIAQSSMAVTTKIGDYYTKRGVGRKVLFLAGLIVLPFRCMLILYWKDSGSIFLLLTQILDGVSGGFFGLLHPYLVADITFGSGRFNLIMGMTASCFGLGATMSNFFGQLAVEKLGHTQSLTASLFLSFIPIAIFAIFMPETANTRGTQLSQVQAGGQDCSHESSDAYILA